MARRLLALSTVVVLAGVGVAWAAGGIGPPNDGPADAGEVLGLSVDTGSAGVSSTGSVPGDSTSTSELPGFVVVNGPTSVTVAPVSSTDASSGIPSTTTTLAFGSSPPTQPTSTSTVPATTAPSQPTTTVTIPTTTTPTPTTTTTTMATTTTTSAATTTTAAATTTTCGNQGKGKGNCD